MAVRHPSFNSVRISLQAEGNAARLAGYQQLSRFQPTVGSDGSFTIPAFRKASTGSRWHSLRPRHRKQDRLPIGPLIPFVPDPTPPPSLVSVPLAGAPLVRTRMLPISCRAGMTVYNTGISVGTQAFDPLDVRVRTDGAEASKELS
jgi:hypothetical protein